MASGLGDVLGMLGQAMGGIQQTKAGMASAYGEVKEGTVGQTQALLDQNAAASVIQAQKDLGELAAQQNIRTAASSMGTNMDDVSQIVTLLGDQMRQGALTVAQQSAKVADIESNNDLFLNPLGFIRDFAVGDQERAKLAAAKNQLGAAAGALDMLNNATQSTARSQLAIAQTKSQATVQAGQDLLKAQADEIAAKGKIALAGTDIDMLNSLSTLDARGTSYAVQAYQIQAQDEQRRWAREEKERTKMTDAEILKYRNLGAASLGLPAIGSVKEMSLERQINPELAGYLLKTGYSPEGGRVPLGSNPIEAVEISRKIGLPVTAGMQDTESRARSVIAASTNVEKLAQMYLDTGMVTGKNAKADATRMAMEATSSQATRKQAAIDYWNYSVTKFQTNPMDEQGINPYAPPPLNVLDSPELTKNPFLAKYVTPQIAAAKQSGNPLPLDPNQLLTSAYQAAFKDGLSTGDIAEGGSFLVQQLMMYNNTARNYSVMGMPISDTFRATAKVGDFAGTLNLANPADWNTFLVQAHSEIQAGSPIWDFLKNSSPAFNMFNEASSASETRAKADKVFQGMADRFNKMSTQGYK